MAQSGKEGVFEVEVGSHLDPKTLFRISVKSASVASVLARACEKLELPEQGNCLRMEDGTIVGDDGFLLSDELKAPNNKLFVGPLPLPVEPSAASKVAQILRIIEGLKRDCAEDPASMREEFDEFFSQSPEDSISCSGIRQMVFGT